MRSRMFEFREYRSGTASMNKEALYNRYYFIREAAAFQSMLLKKASMYSARFS